MRNQLSFNGFIVLLRIVTHHGREKTVVFQPGFGAGDLAE
jgi:hypothetical protein